MTLTYPALDRARRIIWLVTGEDKAEVVRLLRDRDDSIPAGRVSAERALLLADEAAAAALWSRAADDRTARPHRRRRGRSCRSSAPGFLQARRHRRLPWPRSAGPAARRSSHPRTTRGEDARAGTAEGD
jgi:hypothetical protein